jgi:hypothetical protein
VAQGLPRTIAAVFVAASLVHCSLIAPSDQELMGGNKGGGSGSGGDAGRSDAMDGSQGPCNLTGDCCTMTAQCCSGLACETNAGVCVPCAQTGSNCFGTSNTCCSGSCVGHTCK